MSQFSNQRGPGGAQGGQRTGGTGYGGGQGAGYHQRGGERFDRGDRGPCEDVATISLSGIVFADKPTADLFSALAEQAAITVGEAGKTKQKNKSSQLRRFYDELVMWQEKVGNSDERFTDCEPYIRMLKAKVAYAAGRGHVDSNFRELLNRLIDQSTNAARLRIAKLFFEAFLAYYRIHGPQ